MKKLLTASAFLLLCFALIDNLYAQDNQLKLSQVKLVSSEETVPAGKVWKVESALAGEGVQTGNTSTSEVTRQVVVNGNNVAVSGRSFRFQGSTSINNGGRTSDQSYGEYTRLPFWLPAGSTLAAGSGVFEVSVLEFNVVPE